MDVVVVVAAPSPPIVTAVDVVAATICDMGRNRNSAKSSPEIATDEDVEEEEEFEVFVDAELFPNEADEEEEIVDPPTFADVGFTGIFSEFSIDDDIACCISGKVSVN